MSYIIYFATIFFFVKIFLRSSIKKCRTKLPMLPYKLFYTDEKGFSGKNVMRSKILVSEKYNLSGKPDLIYKNFFTGNLIPIELKSGKLGNKKNPRRGDLLQLAVYFVILQDYFKIKPRYGKLIYADCMFSVRNTKKLRAQVFNSLKNMRAMLKNPSQYEKNYAVCENCVCNNSVCK